MLDGQLLDRNDPRLWGAVGRNVLDANTAAPGALDASNYDPRYYEAYTSAGSEGSGGQTQYRLRPEYASRIGDRTQLGQSGVGGYGEVMDPSQLTYDPEFGILSSRSNIKDPQDPRSRMIQNLAMAAWGGGIGGAALSDMGLFGGGNDMFGSGGGLSPEEAAGTGWGNASGASSIPHIGDTGLLAGQELPAMPGLAEAPNVGNAPWYQNIGSTLSNAFTRNPLGFASNALQLGGLLGGLASGGRGSTGGGGWNATGGLMGGGMGSGTKAPFAQNPYTMAQWNQLYRGR